jgi:hypothetical protein
MPVAADRIVVMFGLVSDTRKVMPAGRTTATQAGSPVPGLILLAEFGSTIGRAAKAGYRQA